MSLLIAFLLALGVFGAIIGIYNSLVKLKQKSNEGWADIDTQLKRRYDLIPNLVETVKGYAGHESKTLEAVIQARSNAINASGVKEQAEAENMLSNTLKSIFALSESYPNLKANENFLNLQNTLKEIEENIQHSRRYYNATVRDLNTKIEMFPSNIIANMFNFKQREYFEIEDEAKENVKVDFSSKDNLSKTPASTPEAPKSPETSTPEAPNPAPETPKSPEAPTPTPSPEKNDQNQQ